MQLKKSAKSARILKPKTCKACKNKFQPVKSLQSVCDFKCAIAYSKIKSDTRIAKEQKNARKERKNALLAIKPRSDWMKDAQAAVNSWVRHRDKGKACISCGKPLKPGFHAGHWKPTSSSPELRLNENNIHGQCIQCNLFFHGNAANYRLGLTERVGLEVVEWLEGYHPPKKYSIDDLKQIVIEYKEKLKQLN